MIQVEDRRPRLSLLLLATFLFFAFRLVLLYARDPFFDELFTVWMARQPLSSVIPNLMHDSGPPLYYFLARFDSVTALRWLSLFFATVQFVLIARISWQAAMILAVYPPAALFAVDARAYALCAMLVTAALLLVQAGRRYTAAVAMAAAAYSHYYGVLFLPLLVLSGEPPPRRLEGAAEGGGAPLRSVVFALALFAPGFYMASQQPSDATGWIKEGLWLPLVNFSTAGRYPEALFTPAPWTLVIVALALFLFTRPNVRGAIWLAAPIIAVIAFQLAGRPAYFPMRFEAVLAASVVLLLSRARPIYIALLSLIGAYVITIGAFDHYRRPPDPYRQAAMVLKANAKASDTIVATGYLYLESVVALGRPVIAWPREQALHPGWRAQGADPRNLPQGPFLWIGERGAPELDRMRGVRSVHPLFINERAIVALTRPLH